MNTYYLQMNWEDTPTGLYTLEEIRNILVQDCIDILYQNLERKTDLKNKCLWAKTMSKIETCSEEELQEIANDMGHKIIKGE